MKKAILVAVISAFTLGVNAGDWGKAPIPDKTPIEECVDIGGSISSGYETDYIFYGARFARDAVWTDVNYTFDNFVVPINVGAWYLNGIGGAPGYDELDLYIAAELGTFAGFDVSLGYTHFFFPEGNLGQSYGEIGLDLTRSLGFVDLALEANYALLNGRAGQNTGAWYYQAGIEKTFGITDAVSLVLGTGVGYSDGYFTQGGGIPAAPAAGNQSGWNHYYATASLPIELNCRATLTPYIGYSGAPDTWVVDGLGGGGQPGAQSDILHGGVSLSVSF
ncbi:MAG: hypothetical protein P1U58_00835 [Verrucomicrobiales bacterium]|nr:hypothetical protein [Verrucomicrobiales bacterium]